MSTAGVFIAGHGRMVLGTPTETMPAGISVGWAVPATYASCPQVSRNMIAGRNGVLSDVANPGDRYNEHWLVPDGPENMILKAKDLRNALDGKPGYEGSRNMKPKTYWLLQPRANNAVKLSAILTYLRTKIPAPTQIDVFWTCCRSPIGQPGLFRSSITAPFDAYTKVAKTSTGEVILDPLSSKEGFQVNKHNCADGTVTLVRASDSSRMLNFDTWVGLKTGIAPDGVLPEGNELGQIMVGRALPA